MNEKHLSKFEDIKTIDEKGNEYWLARDLAPVLEYVDYRNFVDVMKKAFAACKKSGQDPRDHFVGVTTMAKIGSGAVREVDNIRLTRYACYLCVQNGDPEKEIIALGQTYFAVQTRLQEIQQLDEYNKLETEDAKRIFLRNELVEHNKQLMATAKGAGVIDPLDYAIFTNWGYKGMYDGLDRTGIQKKKGLKKTDNIADYMGSTELAANLFRATQTGEKLKKDGVKTKQQANSTHYSVGKIVRDTIKEIGGTMPEDLPPAENIKKIEKKSQKQLPNKK